MADLLTAKAAISRGRYTEALSLLGNVTGGAPEDEAVKLILMGESFEGLDDHARAYAAYREAQSVAPGVAAGILREAVLSYKSGDREKARRLLHRYMDREPGNPEAVYYLYLCEDTPERRAEFERQVIVLEGLRGDWSALL